MKFRLHWTYFHCAYLNEFAEFFGKSPYFAPPPPPAQILLKAGLFDTDILTPVCYPVTSMHRASRNTYFQFYLTLKFCKKITRTMLPFVLECRVLILDDAHTFLTSSYMALHPLHPNSTLWIPIRNYLY